MSKTEYEIPELRTAGLSAGESRIYVALLKLGPSLVSDLSQATGLHRTNIYDTIEKLREKGLVSHIVETGKKYFKAASPERLVEHIEEKREIIKNRLPDLMALQNTKKEEVNVEVLKGKNAFKTFNKLAIKELKRTKDTPRFMGINEKKTFEIAEISIKQYWKELERLGVKEKVLIKEGDHFMPGPKKVTEYKTIPSEYFEPIPIIICGNLVAIMIIEPLVLLIKIENSEIANAYKKYFDYLWNMNSITYTGLNGAKKVYSEILKDCKKGDELLVMGASSASDSLYKFFETWEKKITNKEVKVRGIFVGEYTDQIEQCKRNGFEIKTLPEEYISPVEISVYGNKVGFVVFAKEESSSYILHNSKIAESFRQFFEIQWKIAKQA